MAYDGIAYLVQPVHAVESKTCVDDLKVLPVYLRPVDIEYHGKDEDEGPVEVFGAADIYAVHQRIGLG